jgi:LysR family hydrogen peroxide-inducible transcriptional activator
MSDSIYLGTLLRCRFFLNVEIIQLRYLITVVERESFSKAALHCFISQSALSEQIKKLEGDVGATLLDRRRHIIVPTEAGRIFINHAKQIFVELARANQEIQGLDGSNTTGKITLGVLPTIAPYFLPRVLESFGVCHTHIEVKIHEDITASLLRLIETGNADFGIVSSPVTERGFEIEELFSEELLVALPSKHPLADKSSIHLSELRSEKFILMHEGHFLGDQVLGFCQRHDFQPRILIRSGQLDTIQSLIGAGLGVSLVPRMAVMNATERVCYCRLKNPQPRRTIAIIWHRQNRPNKIVRAFFNHLREVGKTFQSPAKNHHSFNSKPKA